MSAEIDSALFEGNTASDSGGAISQDSAKTSLQASVFMGNKALVGICHQLARSSASLNSRMISNTRSWEP